MGLNTCVPIKLGGQMINPIGIITTVVFFKLAEKIKKYPILRIFPPLLLAGIMIILLLKLMHINYLSYKESVSSLTLLLIPATIALGYPLHKNISLLVKNKRIIYLAFFLAAIVAIVSTIIVAKLCGADSNTIISLLPKSVTAPIAIEISKSFGGIPELTICIVVLTGVFGAMIGHKVLKLLGVKNSVAIGLSIGAASHVIGTSKCIEKDDEKQVVMSTLALVIVGVITAIIAPLIIYLVNLVEL